MRGLLRGAPLLLATNVQVPIGGVVSANADELTNDFEQDVQLEEIRFIVSVNGARFNATNAVSMGALGSLVRAQIKMGRLDLTNGYVPIWLLGTRYQAAMEAMTGFSDLVATPNRTAVWEYHRWRFPKPLLVPQGAAISCSFTYLTPTGRQGPLAFAVDSPLNVWVAVAGKALSKRIARPSKIPVPYATYWAPKMGEGVSGDDALFNKFPVPLYVQRFVGRVAECPPPLDPGNLGIIGVPDQEIWFESWAAPNLTIKASTGYDVVGDMTAWQDVFNPARCALEAGMVIDSRDWFTVTVDAPPVLVPGQYIRGIVVPGVSLVGYREEELVL